MRKINIKTQKAGNDESNIEEKQKEFLTDGKGKCQDNYAQNLDCRTMGNSRKGPPQKKNGIDR